MRRTLVAALAAALIAPAAAEAAPGKVGWSPCGPPLQCGTLQVPLDHDAPRGATIGLSVARLPATDPSRRIGSLLLNPGGPGGSGVEFLKFLGSTLFTEEVRARYDLVGFDPRGIAGSTPLRCFGNEKQWSGFFTPFALPETDEEIEQWAEADRYLAEACEQRGGRIASHMATADVARDMDLLRAALGDERLHFYGISYGSYLGTTYANLFPSKVGRLVVDAVLDPIAWSTGDPGEEDLVFSTRLRSAEGAQATLDEFFRLCDAGDCAFGPDSAARYDALRAALRAEPLDGVFDHRLLAFATLGAMYRPDGWEDFAGFLASLEQGVADALPSAATLRKQLAFLPKRGKFPYYNGLEGFPGVACADSDNPDDYAAVKASADKAAAEQSAIFGPVWTWIGSICASWSFTDEDRFTGPWDRAATANPVLVIGNRFDPATPYHGAERVRSLLAGSKLLTLDGWGHASIYLSSCIDDAVEAYLVRGEATDGQVCAPDRVPFAG
jgi:pimeloyl-ACP methyl ester carboxylesterase